MSNRGKGFGFAGFQIGKTQKYSNNAVPPPSSGLSKQGYSTLTSISQTALTAAYNAPKRKAKTEEEYFDEDDEEEKPSSSVPELAYIPAPGSPSYEQHQQLQQQKNAPVGGSDSEEDPLDAYMAGIERAVHSAQPSKPINAGIRDDIEEEDDEESYYRYMEENPNAGVVDEGSDVEIEYDEDGNPIPPAHQKKIIDPLPPIDHSTIEYPPFNKNFYVVHEEIETLAAEQVTNLRKTLGLKVTGPSPPHPVSSFGHLSFDEPLLKSIIRSEYTQPTPIQAQAVPAALSGRDIIGIAKTGSGKTAAFIWPMIVHIMDQPQLQPGDGPIGLILAPTRELSQQIYNEAKKFGKVYNIQVVCAYGGGSKWEQSKALEGGAEIVVATPGRMIDLVKIKATNLKRVTFLVLDEADRMFNMGFEPQVRSICNHVRPDRQTLLFSATFKKKIEKLARDVLCDPVRIVQGDIGEANMDVQQHVLLMKNGEEKFNWLTRNLVEFLSAGSVLVFVTKKLDAEQVANSLILKEFQALLLHGDMNQIDRNKVITQFKRKEVDILVATDVAARGLDIPHIRTVVNYDIARDIDTHTHRIGRTGRAGEKGTAFTLVTERDKEFAGHLVRNLEGVNQEVPQFLMDLAMQSAWFRKSRFKSSKAKNMNVGGCGLGFRERSGGNRTFTSSSASSTTAGSVDFYSQQQPSQQSDEPQDSVQPQAYSKQGPATDRLAAIRAAFKSQYQNQFCASSDSSQQLPPPPPPSSQQASSEAAPKRARKSRWE